MGLPAWLSPGRAPAASSPGDLLFFDTTRSALSPDGERQVCDSPDHVGIISRVDDDGRITFVEARGGAVRRSFVDPARPQVRRDAMGRVFNSFLRPKRIGEGQELPNFAGEMLCGAARARS